MLRHSAGYKLAGDGHDTRSIQDYLGHQNIRHKVRYTAAAARPRRADRVLTTAIAITKRHSMPEGVQERLSYANRGYGSGGRRRIFRRANGGGGA
jgi:hypothetical protein